MNKYLIDILLVAGILIVMILVMVIVVVAVKSNKGNNDEDEPTVDDTGDGEPTVDEPTVDDTEDVETDEDDTGDIEPAEDDTGDIEDDDTQTVEYYLDSYGNLTFTSYASFETLITPISDLLPDDYVNITTIDYSYIDSDVMTSKDSTFSLSGLYKDCSSLTSITFGDYFNTSNVKDMSYMFYYCSALTELDLSGFDTSNVKDMSYMFSNCTSLKAIDLSSIDASKVNTMDSMFEGCESLSSIQFPSSTFGVNTIASMFKDCKSLPSLSLPNTFLKNLACTNKSSKSNNAFENVNANNSNSFILYGGSANFIYCLKNNYSTMGIYSITSETDDSGNTYYICTTTEESND